MDIVWKNFPEPIKSSSSSLLMGNQISTGQGREWGIEEKEVGLVESTQDFMGFISEWKAEGFWMAMYDKPFSQVLGDSLKEIAHAIGIFVLGNADLFFLLPALVLIVGTFMVGRHKYTKWIIPLVFFYSISRIFFWMIR